MTSDYLVANLAAFLFTYLVHSTLLLGPVYWLVAKRRWPADPGLRSQLLKLVLLAPICTTLAFSALGGVHWGPQVSVANLGRPTASEASPNRVWMPSANSLVGAMVDSQASQVGDVTAPPSDLVKEPPLHLSESSQQLLAPGAGRQLNESASAWNWRQVCITAVVMFWVIIASAGLVRLAIQWLALQRIRRSATAIVDAGLVAEMERLRRQLGIRRRVALLASAQTTVPLAAGIVDCFIVVPAESRAGRDGSAMLAHELAHVASRDAVWNLLMQIVGRVFFFQPLNRLASDSLRQEMDFEADLLAVKILGERMSLVQCLYATGSQLAGQTVRPTSVFALASGMALFQSALGQRIELLLNSEQASKRPTSTTRATVLLVTLLCASSVFLLAPRAVVASGPPSQQFFPNRNNTMNRTIASLLVLAGLSMPATADEPKQPAAGESTQEQALSTTPDKLPEGIRRFNGMLVGRVAAKDVEEGTFTVRVDAVPRVWQHSGAENPHSVVGKTVKVSGVFGKFLDVLVVTRIGETVEFECKDDGDGLVFPGELLRKVAPYDPADYPVLPEAFRGFRGQVAGEILKKDPETFELILRVDRVLKTWEENGAKDAKSIEGKPLMLAGFWNRRDAYHALKVGDHIEVGMRHIGLRSDHLTVAEAVNKIAKDGEGRMEREGREMAEREGRDRMDQKDPVQGFKGMLVGRLVEKDIERGTFTITVDAVPRVWENNRSANPKTLIGKDVTAEGVTGRFIDALVVTKRGETLEFGALHDEGPRVRLGEVLRKVAPVQPGDYPVLPDGFRGFRGMVTAKVVRKGDELWELIVEVEEVNQTFDGNRAEKPESIVGKQAMLAGFWNRREEFHNIRVGDRIRCGMNHTQLLSDHLVVIEGIRKVER